MTSTNESLIGFNEVDSNRPSLPRVIDINSNFTYDRNPLLVFDVEAVNNELYNLIYTTPGERPFEPNYGLDLWKKVFDPCDDITAWEIKNILLGGILRWMPHIKLCGGTEVIVKPEWPGFQITIVYTFAGINTNGNETVDFNLLRT